MPPEITKHYEGRRTPRPRTRQHWTNDKHFMTMATVQPASRSNIRTRNSQRKRWPLPTLLYGSLCLNIILVAVLVRSSPFTTKNDRQSQNFQSDFPLRRTQGSSVMKGKDLRWHGGHPVSEKHGTCWCGADQYCMCNPSLAIDLVILSDDEKHVWLVKRKDTSQLATMGGFVNIGETVEEAVARELKEEMGIALPEESEPENGLSSSSESRGSSHPSNHMELLGVYSDPRRDERRHTVSAVFAVKVGDIHPHAADDVKGVAKIPLSEIEDHTYFADHKTILMDYKRSRGLSSSSSSTPSKDDKAFATENSIQRSTCVG